MHNRTATEIQRAYDGADRWVNNVFITQPYRPEPPKARFVRRKPVTIRAMHIECFITELPDEVDVLIRQLEALRSITSPRARAQRRSPA